MFLEGDKLFFKNPKRNPQLKKEKNNWLFDPKKKIFRKTKSVIESFPAFMNGRPQRKKYTNSSIYKIREDKSNPKETLGNVKTRVETKF